MTSKAALGIALIPLPLACCGVLAASGTSPHVRIYLAEAPKLKLLQGASRISI